MLLIQLQESQTDKEKLQGALGEAKKETERLEDALAQFQPNLDDDTSHINNDTKREVNKVVVNSKDEFIKLNVDHEESFGDDIGPEEAQVCSLRRALKDAIGEASKSHGILDSLESRLAQKKSLAVFCEKMKQLNEDGKRTRHDHIVIATDVICQPQPQQQSANTTNNSETNDNEESNEEMKNNLLETRQLLEQNKKLVTILQNKIQKTENTSSSKDEQIRSLTIELRERTDEMVRCQEQVRYFESLHTNDRDDHDHEEDDNDDNNMNDDINEDEEEEDAVEVDSEDEHEGGDVQVAGAESVEIIDVSDDDSNDDETDGRQNAEEDEEEEGENDDEEEEEDDDDEDEDDADQADQQAEAVAVAAAVSNVVEQSEDDEAGEEPSCKRQRVDVPADDSENNIVLDREDNDDENASALV
jgi:hypothetical protein